MSKLSDRDVLTSAAGVPLAFLSPRWDRAILGIAYQGPRTPVLVYDWLVLKLLIEEQNRSSAAQRQDVEILLEHAFGYSVEARILMVPPVRNWFWQLVDRKRLIAWSGMNHAIRGVLYSQQSTGAGPVIYSLSSIIDYYKRASNDSVELSPKAAKALLEEDLNKILAVWVGEQSTPFYLMTTQDLLSKQDSEAAPALSDAQH